MKTAIGIIGALAIVVFLSIGGTDCNKKSKAGSSTTPPTIVWSPSNLVVTNISQTQIDLQWIDNSENENGFELQRWTSLTGYVVISTIARAGVTTYIDSPLTPTTSFRYRVRAYLGTIFSDYSELANYVTTYGNWIRVVAGGQHTFGVISGTNNTWGWGDNYSGELGVGDLNSRTTPAQIGEATNWVSFATSNADPTNISATGIAHTIGRRDDGRMYAWGANRYGQLGLGNTLDRFTPTRIGAITATDWGTVADWTGIAVGAEHTLVRKPNNTLWAWGRNVYTDTGLTNCYGQLGIGDSAVITITTPTQVGTDSDWAAVTSGSYHVVARKNGGSIWSWGYNNYSQLGLGDSSIISPSVLTPTQIGTATDWNLIVAGGFHTIGRKNDYTLWGWGRGDFGQLGIGSTVTSATVPSLIGTDIDWSDVVAGALHNIARKTNGAIYSWGYNGAGQLGLSTGPYDPGPPWMTSPSRIGTETDWSTIAAGAYHSAATKTSPTWALWLWGLNSSGQLGLGDTVDRYAPTMLSGM